MPHYLVPRTHGRYAIGRNDRGQLGLHDKRPRYAFCLLKELYDGIIVKVVAGVDTSFALDYKGDVYGWGGGGVGPIGTVGTFKPREGRNRLKTCLLYTSPSPRDRG